jgi:ABC-type sugar transport system permease subunit/ABC-type glycerol-3-phosphate transport system substrate-binding protein
MAVTAISGAAWAHDGAPETITIYYWGNEQDILAYQVIQDFEMLHDGSDGKPAIKVIMGQSASINKTDDPQRLLCAVAGGDPPDVVFFDRFAVGEWAARGAFRSLQPFLERDQTERPDDPMTLYREQFYEPCWNEAVYDDQLYAVPTTTDNRAMYYNIDLFEKHAQELIAAGCTDPADPSKAGPPQTWAQLRRATEILTEFDEEGTLVRAGFIPNYGNSWLYIYGWLNGGQFMSDDGRTCMLNSPPIVEALVYVTELYDLMGGAEAVNAFQTSQVGGDLDPFLAGKIGMRIDGDGYLWAIANLKRDMRFGVTLAPAPEGKQRLGWCGGWSLVMPMGTEHPDEAWEFMKYMASKRAFKIVSDASRQQSRAAGNTWLPNISARVDITRWAMEYYVYNDPTIPDQFKEAKEVFVETLPFSKYRPVTPVGQLLWNEQVRALDRGIYKEFDPHNIRRNAQLTLDAGAAVVQAELERIYNPKPYPYLAWNIVVGLYVTIVVFVVVATIFYFNSRSSGSGYFRREYYAGYIFALPWFIGFLVFGGGPILFSVFMSLCRYDVFSQPQFVFLRNYVDLFREDPLFYKSLWNTVYMVVSVPLSMAVSLLIALFLSYEIKGMAVYRTIFYLPAIMPAVAASILWLWIFNPQEGVLNAFLGYLGLPQPGWLQNQHTAKPAIILMLLWGAGGGMIIWLAGLKGIPDHLYEAAEIDGAGRLQRFWNITLPMLSPYILLNMIMGTIAVFQIFVQAYMMTQGGPVDSTLFYVYALFNNAFRYMKMGYASAMAWILFAIILVLTLIQMRLARVWVYYESEK